MDSAVGGLTEMVSIDFILGKLHSGHLVLQYTFLFPFLFLFLSNTPSVTVLLRGTPVLLFFFTHCHFHWKAIFTFGMNCFFVKISSVHWSQWGLLVSKQMASLLYMCTVESREEGRKVAEIYMELNI